jgi:hypothetical protein
MKSGPVYQFAAELHHQRAAAPQRILGHARAKDLGRLLAHAVASEVTHLPNYDPGLDLRVEWAREVIQEARTDTGFPRASADLEAMIEYYLGIGDFAPGADTAAAEEKEANHMLAAAR